jgi:hypothetical protein
MYSTLFVFITVLIMLSGAAKTQTENPTQIPPMIFARVVPFAKNWQRRRIKQNPPKFISNKSFTVSIRAFLDAKATKMEMYMVSMKQPKLLMVTRRKTSFF